MLTASLPFRILYRYIYVSEFKEVVDRFRPEILNSSKSSVLFLSSFEEQKQCNPFKVLGVSNGLILYCLSGSLIYYVCDPVTRQWVTLPRARYKSPNKTHPMFFGEGIVSKVNEDNVLTSYTVARVELLISSIPYLSFQTFSSETGKWIEYKLRCTNPIALMKRDAGPITFNGALHWFVYVHGMIAFDPYKDPKSCRFIRFPDDRQVENVNRHDWIYRLCDACQGKLRFFEVARDSCSFYCFSMWEKKDYERGEWCSAFKVTRSDLSSSDPELNSCLVKAAFFPLSFHPFNLDIVYLRCVDLACVVSYSIQDKRLDVVFRPIGVMNDLFWHLVIPFVIPRWPTPVPIPSVPKKAGRSKAAHRRRFRSHT
ncbi:hypothetical protein QVD17_04680 [Tagetes erecta]|uniref:F-box protein At3g26010-like beta-propeller domain-containing protein n=1 Tax=Tagetes erecta TaxID=13708 RepID=A0AAD8LD52_TARER|nr:hypothetical protein QVD17_04680 [Tagetes erecta]